MELTIGKKLTISYLLLALIVLAAGIIGIYILNKVSNSADTVVKEKVPVQYPVMNGALSIEKIQQVMASYLGSTTEVESKKAALLNYLDEFDMWIAMIQYGTGSKEFLSSSAGNLYKRERLTVQIPRGSAEILSIIEKILKKSKPFKTNCNDLLLAHDNYLSYSVNIDGRSYTLPVFLNQIIRNHLEWTKQLKDAVNIVTVFTGETDSEKSLMGRWLSTYSIADQDIMDLLEKISKYYKKLLTLAVETNKQNSYEGKLKIFNRGISSTARLESYFSKLHEKIVPIYESLETGKKENTAALAKSAEAINFELKNLIQEADRQMKSALTESEKVKTSGTYSLIILTILAGLVAFVLGILMSRFFSKSILSLGDSIRKISQGKLQQRVTIRSKDELGNLASDTNTMIDNLRTMIGRVNTVSEKLTTSSGELSGLSGTMNQSADSMRANSESVAAAAEQMSTNMNSVADACKEAAENVNRVSKATDEINASVNEIAQNSENGRAVTLEAVQTAEKASGRINELGTAAKEISRVTEAISEISEQTNLLALNATIEAARAGAAGKGFAVVASEIKELANQTATATDDIRNRIGAIQVATSQTVTEISNVCQVIEKVNSIVSTIAAAVEAQSSKTKEISETLNLTDNGLQDVNGNVSQSSSVSMEIAKEIGTVNSLSYQVKKGSDQVRSNAEDLASLSTELEKLIKQFQL